MSNIPDIEIGFKKQQIDASWSKFIADFNPLTDENTLSPLVSHLAACFNQEFKLVDAKTNFAAYCVDLSAVKIKMSVNTLVCFVRTTKTSVSDIFRSIIENYHAERQQGYTAIVIVDGPTEELEQRFNGHPARILFLSRQSVTSIYISTNWQLTLAALLKENSENIDILSPYNENGVCSPELFYGRANELDILYRRTSSNCHALVGCRRVGKTSLMLDIKRRCEQFGETTYYIDFQSCSSEKDFVDTLIRETRRKDLQNKNVWTIKEYLQRLANLEGPVVNLFLDEMDAIAVFDKENDYQIIKDLAAATTLSGKAQIKIWIAGFKELYWAIADREGPLYNKMSAEVIGPLEQHDAEKLITTPIKQLGLKFENEQSQLNYIIGVTNNHPGFLQLYCRLLIKELTRANKTVITMTHLEAVRQHSDLLDYVKDYFAINTTALEKMIVLSMLDFKNFSQEMVSDTLTKYSEIKLLYKPLYKEMRDLRFGGIFNQVGELFSFQFPILSEILKKSADYIKRDELQKAQTCAHRVNESSN